MPKRTTAVQPARKAKFKSADALFDHLRRKPQNVTVSGAMHPIDGEDGRVLFTPNGRDWLAMPVERIQDAKVIGRTQANASDLSHVQVTLSPPSGEEGALFSQLTSLHQPAFPAPQGGVPTSPPPVCPNGIARWVVDHWECT